MVSSTSPDTLLRAARESNTTLMQDEASSFTALLRACAKSKDLAQGSRAHDELQKRGLLHHCSDALVLMYAKCGALVKAKHLLHLHKTRNVSSWTALIAGYAQHGQGQEALNCFECMQREGISPSITTFACILKTCGSLKAIEKGGKLHEEIARQGMLEKEIVLGNALVDMYAKCGALLKAQRVFEELPCRNVVTWNAMIGGYAQHGQGQEALNCFARMQREGFSPNAVTFISILKACGSVKAISEGEIIHDEIARKGLLRHDIVLGTALVDMYAKCGVLAKAQYVLERLPSRDVITWSALIAGYAHQGQAERALKCLEKMQYEGISPNAFTFACLIQACSSIKAVDKGAELHDQVARQGLLKNDIVLGTALVDMYAKCGALVKAEQVLQELPSRDVIAWSALITGYAQQGQGEQALRCFEEMQREGLTPNAVTFTCILKACGSIGAADKGEQIHDIIARQGLLVGKNIVIATALVDMYAKCGAFTKAAQVLKEIQSVVPWNALMTGYLLHGENQRVLNCFEEMQCKGISPNEVTFSCILNACSRIGLVEKGNTYFLNMSKSYKVEPVLEHYVCMVDLFGRAGHFDKAVQLIQRMPTSDHMAVWSALLGACQTWGDVEVGRWAFERALSVDKTDGAAYVLMGNIYAAAGMNEDVKSVEAMRKQNRAWKQPGYCFWFDATENFHVSVFVDTSTPRGKLRYGKPRNNSYGMSRKALTQGQHKVLSNMHKAVNHNMLYSRSEKLALAHAFVSRDKSLYGSRLICRLLWAA